jgi:hypothetical protein
MQCASGCVERVTGCTEEKMLEVAARRSRGSGVCKAQAKAATTGACKLFLVRCEPLHASFHGESMHSRFSVETGYVRHRR